MRVIANGIRKRRTLMMYDLPNGWTCCGCGDEYLKDFIGEHIAIYDNGTYCKECKDE